MNILDGLHKKIINSLGKEEGDEQEKTHASDLIALGVLLWVVADADDKFLAKEEEQIKITLKKYNHVSEEDMPIVLCAIREAALTRIDVHMFTREICQSVNRQERIGIIENLFRVACADLVLDNAELEMIRKISGLLGMDHAEMIEAKIKVKKEFGLDTAGF